MSYEREEKIIILLFTLVCHYTKSLYLGRYVGRDHSCVTRWSYFIEEILGKTLGFTSSDLPIVTSASLIWTMPIYSYTLSNLCSKLELMY